MADLPRRPATRERHDKRTTPFWRESTGTASSLETTRDESRDVRVPGPGSMLSGETRRSRSSERGTPPHRSASQGGATAPPPLPFLFEKN